MYRARFPIHINVNASKGVLSCLLDQNSSSPLVRITNNKDFIESICSAGSTEKRRSKMFPAGIGPKVRILCPPGGGDFDGTFDMLLTFDLAEIMLLLSESPGQSARSSR